MLQSSETKEGIVDLQKLYKLKTGEEATWMHIEGERYTAQYVKWLEKYCSDSIKCSKCKSSKHVETLCPKCNHCPCCGKTISEHD